MTTKKSKPITGETTGTEPTAVTAELTSKATKAARGGKARTPGKEPGKGTKPARRPAVADTKAKAERRPRTDTKQAKLIAMLQAKDGATVEEIAAAFGWQNHTVRGALYGALKKKLGLDVASEKVEARGRVYRVGN
jgi:hypothetical protein